MFDVKLATENLLSARKELDFECTTENVCEVVNAVTIYRNAIKERKNV